MARFRDVYLSDCVPGYPCLSSPRFSTRLPAVDSGAEGVNIRWEHPLRAYRLPEAVRAHEVFESIHDHWLVMHGPAYSFPFRDPLDFASVALPAPNQAPAVSGLDQVIGTGDGVSVAFQLVKTYSRGGFQYIRKIYHPVVDTVVVTIDGVDPSTLSPAMTYTVNRATGVVTTSYPPAPGRIVRAGYLFDVEVRFESDDSFDGIVQTYGISGFADLTLLEVRPCD